MSDLSKNFLLRRLKRESREGIELDKIFLIFFNYYLVGQPLSYIYQQ